MYVPEHLERWKLPRDYFGAEWPEYYSAGVGRSRDSDCGEESNFDAMLQGLGGESATVQVVRESHWAVGWVEWIAIHESDEQALRAADAMKASLEDYPILDEEDHSRREWEECERVWSDCYSVSERARYLRKHRCTEGFRDLRAAVNGDWGAAANLLPCPQEIIY
jgi:hypothetical protein